MADLVNGMVIFTGNSVGDTAAYTCNSGFELVGSTAVTCTQADVNSAAFSPAPPVCRRKYCMNNITRKVWSGYMTSQSFFTSQYVIIDSSYTELSGLETLQTSGCRLEVLEATVCWRIHQAQQIL